MSKYLADYLKIYLYLFKFFIHCLNKEDEISFKEVLIIVART